jgi:hypothetical protein
LNCIGKFAGCRVFIANPPNAGVFMPFDVLGKMLFPHLKSWERRRKVKLMLGVLFAALVCAGCVGLVIYRQGHR